MEFALIGLILAGALLFMVRRVRRALAPDQDMCTAGCGCGSSCQASRNCACADQSAAIPIRDQSLTRNARRQAPAQARPCPRELEPAPFFTHYTENESQPQTDKE